MLINLLAWVIVGGLAGWIASKIAGTDKQMGLGANIVVGILGAIIGGFITRTLVGETADTFSIMGFIVAVVGALILLSVLKMLGGRR